MVPAILPGSVNSFLEDAAVLAMIVNEEARG
jgi:hypothetical protein